MTPDMLFVFAILGLTIVLFLSDRLRLDLVALLSLLALLLGGVLTPDEALAGFSDPIVLIIAGLFVVGGGLLHTGVAGAVGRWLARTAGVNPIGLTVATMLVVALLSAFMSSTGATAVLVPVVVTLARNARTHPSKLLLPLAYGALLGGMLTLIGTPPNIVVSNQLQEDGLEPFSFFAFAPFGVVALVTGIVFMVLVGRRFLPTGGDDDADAGLADAPSIEEMGARYRLPEDLYRLRVRSISPLVDRALGDTPLGCDYHVNVLEIQSWPDHAPSISPPRPATAATRLKAHDVLHVQGSRADVARLAREQNLGIRPAEEAPGRIMSRELGLVEAMPTPDSRMLGRTLQEMRFRTLYGLTVLGIRRMGKHLPGDPATVPLRFGDTLLLEGPWARIVQLQEERRNLVVVGLPREMAAAQRADERAPLAVLILAGMLALITLTALPTVTAVLLAALAMVLCGCLRPQDLYTTIRWESVVLIAGMLPMSTALLKTGGVEYIAGGLTNYLGALGPLAVLAGLFFITGAFSQVISNTATTVLVAPIAFAAAATMGVAPQAFLMAVAIAASSAFVTPMASPVNTLVLVPGDYRFGDFLRVGLPLQMLMAGLVVLVLPLLFPF